jgi:integrase
MKRQQKTIGQRRLPSGNIQVFCNVAGHYFSKTFPATSTPGERNAWRDRTIAEHGGRGLAAGSFAADAQAFLDKPEVAAMPSIKAYTAILQHWLDALGPDRPRHTITRDAVETVLQDWLKTLSPVTVYHRRTVLGRLFAVLDGPHAPSPVKGTTRPDHHRPVDRSLDFATIARILAAMADGQGARRSSLAKLRATVIAHTGIPPSELQKLRPQDFDRKAALVRMPWRDKGAGTAAHTRELSPEGVAAFVALDNAHGWGGFATEAVSRSFRRAVRRVLGPSTGFRLYDLRHSFGTEVYRSTRDLATVARLLGHAEGSPVTARYAMGANAEVDRAALAALSSFRKARLEAAEHELHVQLHATLHAGRKRRKAKRLRAVS